MKKYCFISIILVITSCSTNHIDLDMNEVSLNKIEEIEKLNDFMLADFDNLLEFGKQHTECYEFHGDKCYLPSNSYLLHKYLDNPSALKHLNYLTDNGIITGNICIRSDSTIRFEVKYDQYTRGQIDAYKDTVYHHEIVHHISKKSVYELGDYIIIKSKQIKPDWAYYITKQWVD